MFLEGDEQPARASHFKYSNEELLAELLRVADIVNKLVITRDDFDKHARMSIVTTAGRLGGWRNALEQAGIGHRYYRAVDGAVSLAHTKYSDEELLEEVRRVAGLVEKPVLTAPEFKKHSKLGLRNLQERFGGWKDLLERAGLDHMRSKRLIGPRSSEDILDQIRRFYASTSLKDFTCERFSSAMGVNSCEIRHIFGNWRKATEAAGLPHRRGSFRYSDEACLINIANLWAYYGRPPAYKELNGSQSSVCAGVYDKRWRGLRKTFDAFLEWIDSEHSLKVHPNGQKQDIELEPVLKFQVMRRDNFRCVACGKGPTGLDGVELHIEQIVYASAGDKTDFANLQTKCSRCGSNQAHQLAR
jgi:hypothetical protein